MRKAIAVTTTLFFVTFASIGAARAAGKYGLVSGETVDGNMVSGEAGWPDVSFQFTHGLSSSADIGARFSLMYGIEGVPKATEFGLGLRAPIRVQVLSGDTVLGLIHFDPGIKIFTKHDPIFGLTIPVGFMAGYQLSKTTILGGGLDLGASLYLSPHAAFFLTPTLGPSFEHHFDDHLGFALNTRFGFSHFFDAGGATELSFLTQAGLLYAL